MSDWVLMMSGQGAQRFFIHGFIPKFGVCCEGFLALFCQYPDKERGGSVSGLPEYNVYYILTLTFEMFQDHLLMLLKE